MVQEGLDDSHIDWYGFYSTCIGDDSLDDTDELTLEEVLRGQEILPRLTPNRDELQCFEDNKA